MDRNHRDARRATVMSASINPSLSNALPRRRHRTSLRDSLEDDVPLELPDASRTGLRDRHVGGKKDRERADRVDRDRERLLRKKRRRGDGNSNNHRLIHHGGTGNRGEDLGMVADESSEESVNDNEDEDDYEHLHHQQHTRLLQPASAVTSSASMMLNSSRRSYPPSASAVAAAASAAHKVVSRPAWKATDEMIGVSVPRKARSASAKRSHDCWVGGGTTVSHAGGDLAARQSPARPGPVAASPVNNRPASPSSSNASPHKKLKPNGPKQRPLSLKSVSKPVSSSATQDEIEIAEVLYGMMRQPLGPSPKSETSFGGESVKTEVWRDENNKPMPVSNSGSVLPPQNSGSSIPLTSAIAPKRKKPRAVKYDEEIQAQSMYPSRNNTMAAKIEVDSAMKIKSSLSMDRGIGPGMAVNGGTYEPGKPQDTPVPLANHGEDASKMEGLLPGSNKWDEPRDSKQELHSLKKESDGKTEPQRSIEVPEVENQREEKKFQIDLMAPPPTRSSPGRDGHGDSPAGADQISNGTAVEEGERWRTEAKKNKEGGVNAGKEEEVEVAVRREAEGDGKKSAGGGGDSKGVVVDLQIDMETGGGSAGVVSKRNHPPFPKQQQPAADKSAPSAGPFTFPFPVAGWPGGGLPPMGYMPPLPGVVSMDGSAVTSSALQPPPLLFSQPRPKRCATHWYVARNISYHQQMARIPFWPTAAAAGAGPLSLYGAKPFNVNVMPSADPNGNVSTRSVNAVADKGQNLGLPGHSGKDKGSQTSSEAQRKPVLLQQSIPPGAPSNLMHGPTFIFPLSQQHAAAAVNSVRSGSSKSPNISSTAAAPGAAAASVASSAVAPTGAAAAMSFSYPNMPGGETEYLAILQNNSYPFPVPTLMGAAPAYRGTHPQAMPFFSGPFFSSQMLHPSQLPQQVPANLAQLQGQGHQNSSSSSMKHLQNVQKPPGTVGNGSSLQGIPSGKNQPSPQTLMQQPQIDQQQQQQVRPSESEFAGGDSLLNPDARIPRTNMTTIYGQNFAMPMHASNFSLTTQGPQGSVTGANSNNTGEKKQQPQLNSQHQGSKQYAVDSLQSQAFALSFGNMGNSASAHALDISSIAQGHTVLQSLPEATSHTYQMMAAAVAAQNTQQKKNIRPTDDGCKGGGNDTSNDYDRKPVGGKSLTTGGQSITFSRPDMMDSSVSSLTGGSVVDSSVRTLNLGSSSSRATVSVLPAQANTNPSSPSPQQVQRSQQQQIIQLQKQHQFAAAAAAAARSKTPASSNGSVYNEHLGASASAGAKYASSLSTFPQNFVQGSGSPAQSPQWKGSTRPVISPMPSPISPATATSQSLKHLSQQPVQRMPPGQTHISFANSNSKSSNPSQGQQMAASSQQSPSSPAVVGSPTTSSVSKSTGGSPRTTTSSTGNKPIQGGAALQAQQSKSSIQPMPMHKSSPVGSGNVPSILGNSPLTASTGPGAKHQLPQQQQLSKQNLQQAQLFFSHPYVPVPAGHSAMNSTSTASNAYYMQRRPSEQQQPKAHLSQGSGPPSSSSAMLSLCPPITVSSSGSCDPGKAVAASNLKGSNLQVPGILHAAPFTVTQSSGGSHQIVSYVHAGPNAVKVEQKPPAGE